MLIVTLELSIWHVSVVTESSCHERRAAIKTTQGWLVEQSKELPKSRETLFAAFNS